MFGNIILENEQYSYAQNLFVAKAGDFNGSGSLPETIVMKFLIEG